MESHNAHIAARRSRDFSFFASCRASASGRISDPALEKSGVETQTLRHAWRLWKSFRLGLVFSSLGMCLRRKSAARIAGPVIILCALPGLASAQTWGGTGGDTLWNNPANWNPSGVPASTGTATYLGRGHLTSISTRVGFKYPKRVQFNATDYIFEP